MSAKQKRRDYAWAIWLFPDVGLIYPTVSATRSGTLDKMGRANWRQMKRSGYRLVRVTVQVAK